MVVESDTVDEAVQIAESHEVVSEAWQEDHSYFSFDISGAEEINEEEG